MYRTATQADIDKMLTGIEVQGAVDLVVEYIRKNHKFATNRAAHSYWSLLSEDDKVHILKKALEQQ